MGTATVEGHIYALKWCLGIFGHWKGTQTHMVSGNIWALKDSPGTYGHRIGGRAHFGTGRVPTHIWGPEWCLRTYGHRNGARTHMRTLKLPGHIWNATQWCLGIYGTRNGAWAHMGNRSGTLANMGTVMVPRHIWAPEGCPGTYGHWKGAQEYKVPEWCLVIYRHRNSIRAHMGPGMVLRHMCTRMVLGHIWALEGCPGIYGNRKGARA